MTPRQIYDPGGDDIDCELDQDCMLLCVDALMAVVDFLNPRPAAFREGEFEANGVVAKMFSVLWDSGACHRSYISKDIVEKNRDVWKDVISPFKSTVRLADQLTTVRTTEKVRGKLSFVFDTGEEVIGEVDAVVWEMKSIEFILGLPDILSQFLDLFIDMLRRAREDLLNGVVDATEILVDTDMKQGDERQWSTGNPEIVEEEEMTYVPVQFESVLNYMETTYQESREAYLKILEEHIGPLLADCGELRDLLKSPLAMDRFVPKEWTGIKGFPPLDLQTREDLPEFHKCRTRPVNKDLVGNAYKEYLRLCKYMFNKECRSPWASPLVIAFKAGPPGIRYCGDYRWLNTYLICPQAYIPNVQRELEKASGFRYMGDLDVTNAFHQWPITQRSSDLLAVQTPWGLVSPKFMPEGISPASGYLQMRMMQMFADFQEWTIVIFDNILILGHDEEDFLNKMRKFLSRCEEHNVYLKYSKTWLGFESVKFFGYKVKHGTYELDEDRKKAIMECPMPTSVKGMQSFLGAALFFKNHVPNFSEKAHKLHKMTHKNFSWDRRTWQEDYEEDFKRMKNALADSVALHFPDYSLPWVLRVDASKFACGAVLYQILSKSDGSFEYQPIGFASRKFSEQALKWDTMKKETFGLYWGVKHFEYFLRVKGFVAECDHRNVLWLDKSEVPIIMRWRVYLQSFVITIRHISGAKNTVADWLSRMHPELVSSAMYDELTAEDSEVSCMLLAMMGGWDEQEESSLYGNLDLWERGDFDFLDYLHFNYLDALPDEATGEAKVWTPEEMFTKIHGGRNFHWGARRTWIELNRRFPGHKISYRRLAEMIMECVVCQKNRNDMTSKIEPLIRHIKPPHWRARVGVDNLKVTPADAAGNEHLIIVVDQFSRYTWGMPAKSYEANTIATALFIYFTTFGVFDELWSDPGSDLMSDTLKQLNLYLGIKHVVSLVDRHQSNGVEGPNKQVLRHLRTLVYDTRTIDRWSDPTILCMVFFVINDSVHSETGFRPLDLKFGSDDGPYLRLPEDQMPEDVTQKWLKDLNKDLRHIRSVSLDHQSKIAAERTATTPPEKQNVYQPGDLVLLETNPCVPRATKLTPLNLGPFEVVHQKSNDVCCRNLATDVERHIHVSQLKMFYGTKDQGKEMAMLDADRFQVRQILAWRGTVKERACMWFYVEFADGEKKWLPWSRDLDDSQPYGDYMLSEHPLYLLRFKAAVAPRERVALNKQDITEIKPGDNIFVDLRRWGECWYDQLNLPDSYTYRHVVPAVYTRWDVDRRGNSTYKRIKLRVELFGEDLIFDHYDVMCWGRRTKFVPEEMLLVDASLVSEYPSILTDDVPQPPTPTNKPTSARGRGKKR